MATETKTAGQAAPEAQTAPSDYSLVQKQRGAPLNSEFFVAPTCMIWSMVIAIGGLILMMIFWALPHLGTIFQ